MSKMEPRTRFALFLLSYAVEHDLPYPQQVTIYLEGDDGWPHANSGKLTMEGPNAVAWCEALGVGHHDPGDGSTWSDRDVELGGFSVTIMGARHRPTEQHSI